ncbi:uncharacterized protein LOC141643375 [Silene latifolia]|uniref:uncharacterized protein LOC141643375 n=1 Tax=Silene latifolia TaxID=37657 RepID=UPI003D770EB2
MDINHIHNHHDHLPPPITTPPTTTSNYWVEENFSMAMDDHHAHHHHHHHHQQHLYPITPLVFDPVHVWPNYIHTSIPSSSSSSKLLTIEPTIQYTTKENHEIDEEQEGKEEDEDEDEEEGQEEEELGAMKEMMYRYAVMQPVNIDPSTIRKPKRRNVRISTDPQSVAARHRRERISEKIRILQRLVPGGTKMDTASMLDEAIRYVKFLKKQIKQLQRPSTANHVPPPVSLSGWAGLPSASLVGPSSDDPREGKIVLMRDHFYH